MKRRPRQNRDSDLLAEYDFSRGERGKYAKRYRKGSNVVVLDPEVARVFPNPESVNEALRILTKIIRRHARVESG